MTNLSCGLIRNIKSLLSRIKQVFMKQMWEKKKAHYCCNRSKCVEKSDTFGSELAGKVLLCFVRSSLKWYKEAKDEDKSSHCEIFLQWPRALSPVCLTSGRGGNGDGDWVALDTKQTKWISSGEGLITQQSSRKREQKNATAKDLQNSGKVRKYPHKKAATSFRKKLRQLFRNVTCSAPDS